MVALGSLWAATKRRVEAPPAAPPVSFYRIWQGEILRFHFPDYVKGPPPGGANRCSQLLILNPADERYFNWWLLHQAPRSRASQLYDQVWADVDVGAKRSAAVAMLEGLAQSGDLDAMRCLGIGRRSLHWLDRASRANDPLSMYALSHRLRFTGGANDARALELLVQSAEAGLTAARFEMGLLYGSRQGEANALRRQWSVRRDDVRACFWFCLAESRPEEYNSVLRHISTFPTMR